MPSTRSHYRAVVFDLDGTLLDTLADIGGAANAVLAHRRFAAHPIDNYRQFVGEGVTALFQRALAAEQPDAETIADCVRGFQIEYDRNWNILSRPYQGIPELLGALAKLPIKLAVLSNKPHEFTERLVRYFFSGQKFEAVLGERAGVPRKPDPAGAFEISQRLGVAAHEFVYLGDSAVDMQTARRAGMFPVGAAWGFRSVEELRSAGAGEIIAEPLELLALMAT
jgi:phosphoglycolate phosphatase